MDFFLYLVLFPKDIPYRRFSRLLSSSFATPPDTVTGDVRLL